ncbi:hypothetical protein KL86APRO_20168 [uncultured Alphaproteobacteria bacterium]|uniref:Uncharacterized protein n=1 Tax=uncultured Alphaproteobacteria bacterium TaxID=91750 RepID=A0A212KIA7_9PROT|nr:hypothetical protein KL86APRO_20168 [uncultured Alphaproteobacteria bacterium]
MTDAERIVAYLRGNRVLTVCSARGSAPWAASCFYVLDETRMALLILSGLDTRHGRELRDAPRVAGTVASQQANVAKIRGVQVRGRRPADVGGGREPGAHPLLSTLSGRPPASGAALGDPAVRPQIHRQHPRVRAQALLAAALLTACVAGVSVPAGRRG